ncbi:DUF7144 family membrane protein [Actinomadura mexicana]|uniref:DUF7144 domain-containing protein n=1 Tax=Actinomadura mexicana TaxID=134959 RepID=A0A239CMY3_9ACTN|nr:hypothetical protein [Actinomadura mexicana]SNS21507.1 hypothetical protein SAMN06265355_11319 [Actinomadura mexicana]
MTTRMSHGGRSATARQGYRLSGWLTFAGTLSIVVGAFNVIDGVVALFKDSYYVVNSNQILVFNFTAWGWYWLVLGALQIVVGVGILTGKMWARVVGVLFAFLAAIGHLAFLAAFPLWSVLTIALCILLMYALIAPPAGARGD